MSGHGVHAGGEIPCRKRCDMVGTWRLPAGEVVSVTLLFDELVTPYMGGHTGPLMFGLVASDAPRSRTL